MIIPTLPACGASVGFMNLSSSIGSSGGALSGSTGTSSASDGRLNSELENTDDGRESARILETGEDGVDADKATGGGNRFVGRRSELSEGLRIESDEVEVASLEDGRGRWGDMEAGGDASRLEVLLLARMGRATVVTRKDADRRVWRLVGSLGGGLGRKWRTTSMSRELAGVAGWRVDSVDCLTPPGPERESVLAELKLNKLAGLDSRLSWLDELLGPADPSR